MSKRPCSSMDVSCRYLQVFSGPQGMDKNRSCFLFMLIKKRCKSTTKDGYMQTPDTKGPKRTMNIL